ncbi:hypothetical protein SAMN06273570_4408 [Candidatus Pantoea floridensis]|uniref:Uncharacterized protein n=1 Tax=Candidatus Pantoea floridensis TaxID=1938870 RepID=A0A286DM24_9GAMM|nr:hypothetical protein BX596_3806 [Enterobacteriaceae bacterium JKS000233]SOD59738.1 hypothetical protein SAMN06273570_4408 [Pantoea floridensis]
MLNLTKLTTYPFANVWLRRQQLISVALNVVREQGSDALTLGREIPDYSKSACRLNMLWLVSPSWSISSSTIAS